MFQPFPHGRLLVECLRADMCPSVNMEMCADTITDLFDLQAIFSINPWIFDTHSDATVRSFPHIGKSSRGNWTIANSGETTANNIRRWKDRAVAADGL